MSLIIDNYDFEELEIMTTSFFMVRRKKERNYSQ